jgi:hypothetical protein
VWDKDKDGGTLVLRIVGGKQITCGGGLCDADIGVSVDETVSLDVEFRNPEEAMEPQVGIICVCVCIYIYIYMCVCVSVFICFESIERYVIFGCGVAQS